MLIVLQTTDCVTQRLGILPATQLLGLTVKLLKS